MHSVRLLVCLPERTLVLVNELLEIYIQGVLLPDRQTLRGDSRHEDKIGNHGAQTSSVGVRGHLILGSKISNDDKKREKKVDSFCDFR